MLNESMCRRWYSGQAVVRTASLSRRATTRPGPDRAVPALKVAHGAQTDKVDHGFGASDPFQPSFSV